MTRRYASLLILAVLAGCSSASKSTKVGPAKVAEFQQSATFTVRWHRNIGDIGEIGDCDSGLTSPGEVRWRSYCNPDSMGHNVLTPVFFNNAVYAASATGELFKLDNANGDMLWRAKADFAISGGVGAGDGLVLVTGEKGEVAALGEDGQLRWQTKVSSEVISAPQVAGGIVVVRSGDGRIAGLNATDGKRRWLYEHTVPALAVRSQAGVLIRHGVVYAGFAAGKLVALDLASGNAKWEAAVSQPRGNTELERISDITSLPEVDDEQVCAVSFQGRIGCFDLAQGNLMWSRDISSDKGMSLLRKYLYVTDAQGAILAMDKGTGASVWKNDQLFMRRTTTPDALEKYIVAGDYQGYVYAFRRDDGSLAARIKTDGSPILSAPVEADDALLVQTRDGGLYSIVLQ